MSSSWRNLDLREWGDWPLRYRSATCVLLALLAFVLPWCALTRPMAAQEQGLTVAHADVQAQLLAARQRRAAFPAGAAPLPEAVVPASPNLPELLTMMADTAQRAQLRGGQFRPHTAALTAPDADPGPAIEFRLSGTWPQLYRFAAALTTVSEQAILAPHDVRLRAQANATLELSATVLVHPPLNPAPMPLPSTPTGDIPPRNPFAGIASRPHHVRVQTVGSLRSGQREVGLVLSADGQLRPVVSK